MMEIILTSSILIVLLAVLRRALRGRINPCVQYALWLLVAARLLIPGTLFDSPLSVLGAVEQLQASAQLAETVAAPSADQPQLPAEGPAAPSMAPKPDGPAAPFVTLPTDGPTVAFELKSKEAHAVENLLDLIWKGGIAVVGGAMVVSNLIFYLRLRKTRKRLEAPAAPWAGDLPVYEADSLPSPCLFGLFQPGIYLNEAAVTAEHPEHILAHEYAHYRCGDHLWSILRCVCLAVHWYNPLVWWAAALSRRDCELACDASALKHLGEGERIDYGQTLLGMVSRRTSPAALLHTATTMTAGKRTMAERIALIVKQPRMHKATLALVTAVACLLAACTFSGKTEDDLSVKAADLMEYPGFHWNDSVETVLDTLGITEADFLSSTEAEEGICREWSFDLETPSFAPEAQYARFHFSRYTTTGQPLGLDQVTLYYPDDMEDFDALRDELIQKYGPGIGQANDPESALIIEESISDHHVKRELDAILGDNYARWEELQKQNDAHYLYWNAGMETLTDDAMAKRVEAHYQDYLTSPSYDSAEEYFARFPLARIAWNNASLTSYTFNTVTYDGNGYVYLLQKMAGENTAPARTVSSLEFPGLHWNDTPETVMEKLGVTEADFLETYEDEDSTSSSWSFVLGDYPLFGHTAQYVIFDFIQHAGTGQELGLYLVRASYPDDMEDFGAVADELVRRYGPADEESDSVRQINGSWQNILGDRYDQWVELQQKSGTNFLRWNAAMDDQTIEELEAQRGESFEQFLEDNPRVALYWNSNSLWTPTFNVVGFDGSAYVFAVQVYSVTDQERDAGRLVNSVQLGYAPKEWLSLMSRAEWKMVRQAAVSAGLDDGDGSAFAAVEIIGEVAQYVDQQGLALTETECLNILNASKGLDGAVSEAYRDLLQRLHAATPGLFAQTLLELPEEQRDIVLDYYRDGDTANREEVIAGLEREIETSLTAAPSEMTLTKAGETFQFLPVGAYGDYTAICITSNPAVVRVGSDGTVTARGPGEADVTMHFDGDQGKREFVCHVRCEFETEDASAAPEEVSAQAEQPADSPPLSQTGSFGMDGDDRLAWLDKTYADGDFGAFSIAVNSLAGDDPLITSSAEKAYAEGEIGLFSILANRMDKIELENWLDRAIEDGKWDFQSMLFDRLDMDDEKDAQEEEWARRQTEEYQAAGVTKDGKNYYYQGQLVNIFLDMRYDRSMYTLDLNASGTVNIKIIRNADNKITGVDYMTDAEVKELLDDMRDTDDDQDDGQESTIPVEISSVEDGEYIWLGTYELTKGDRVSYHVSAETGLQLSIGFAKPGQERPDTTYHTISNPRADGKLEVDSGVVSWNAASGRYSLFIHTEGGSLTGVTGNVTITKTSANQ